MDDLKVKLNTLSNKFILNKSISFNRIKENDLLQLNTVNNGKIKSLGVYFISEVNKTDKEVKIISYVWNQERKEYIPLIQFSKKSYKDFITKIQYKDYLDISKVETNSYLENKYFFTKLSS